MTDEELEAYMEERKTNRAKAEGLVVQKSAIEAEIQKIAQEEEVLATKKSALVQQVTSLDTQIHALMNTSAPAPVKVSAGGGVGGGGGALGGGGGGGFVRRADEQQQRTEKIEALCFWLHEQVPDFNASATKSYATAFYNNNATTVERLAKKNKEWFVERCGVDADDASDILEALRLMTANMEAAPVMAALVEASSPSSSIEAAADIFKRISDLTHNDEVKRAHLGAATGLVEAMLALAKMHMSEVRVVENALWSIPNFASGNAENKAKLVQAGACQAVIEAMSRHASSSDVANYGCRAISSLATDDDNRAKLGRAGACQAVVEAMSRHASSSDVAKYGCIAIYILAINNADNKRILLAAGAVERITTMANNNSLNDDARSEARDALTKLQ